MFKPLAVTAILALTLFTGCSKLTKENYDQIKVGMPYDDVIGLIGKPENCSETLGMKNCTWKSGQKKASIAFLGDKVTLYSSENLK